MFFLFFDVTFFENAMDGLSFRCWEEFARYQQSVVRVHEEMLSPLFVLSRSSMQYSYTIYTSGVLARWVCMAHIVPRNRSFT